MICTERDQVLIDAYVEAVTQLWELQEQAAIGPVGAPEQAALEERTLHCHGLAAARAWLLGVSPVTPIEQLPARPTVDRIQEELRRAAAAALRNDDRRAAYAEGVEEEALRAPEAVGRRPA